jgi:hypothetical protein
MKNLDNIKFILFMILSILLWEFDVLYDFLVLDAIVIHLHSSKYSLNFFSIYFTYFFDYLIFYMIKENII